MSILAIASVEILVVDRLIVVDKEVLEAARKQASNNWAIGKMSAWLGCFTCGSIFKKELLDEDSYWMMGDGSKTILCPKCYFDTVLCDAGDYPVSLAFLEAMNKKRFN